MNIYVLKANGFWEDDVYLTHEKQIPKATFKLLVDKIFTEWSNTETGSKHISKELCENLGFKILEELPFVYVDDYETGINEDLYEEKNDNKNEYDKAYKESLKRIFETGKY